jgi:hypothetical protein
MHNAKFFCGILRRPQGGSDTANLGRSASIY